MKNPSYHNFASVPSVQIPRSVFDMSSRYKTTFDSGKVVPCMAPLEVLPGDTIDLSIQSFARLTTPIVPFMDNLIMDFQFFYVPSRLVWDNWKRFMGEQDNPGDSIDYLIPQVESPTGGFPVGSLADYFGLPTGVAGLKVNSLPFRAYNLIWNEFYRPELLANSVEVDKTDGPDDWSDYTLLPRFNRLDYFQGATPAPQKGAGVELPLGGTAPVTGSTKPIAWLNEWPQIGTLDQFEGKVTNATQLSPYITGSTLSLYHPELYNNGDVWVQSLSDDPRFFADLSQATMVTINSLRQAFQVQKFLEREMVGGSRYTELCRSMFGVISPDARLQRPEFLGSGSLPIVISTVPQTSSTDSTSPQGNLAAFGLTKGKLPHIKKSFVEHGYVFAFLSVRAPITYQQGIDRFWSRRTRFDFYWPVFAHLGEQAILNKEIYAQGTDADDEVFGYQERFAEYRYGISHVTGKLRSSASGTLDYWHLAPQFSQLPELGADFAKVNVPLARVLAVQNEPQFVYDSFINGKMFRPMPIYGDPGRIDHWM